METIYAFIIGFMLLNLFAFCVGHNAIDMQDLAPRHYHAMWAEDVFRISINDKKLLCVVEDTSRGGLFTKFRILSGKSNQVFYVRTQTLPLLNYEFVGTIGMFNYLIYF